MSASLNDRPNRVEVSGDAATVTAGAGVQGAQGEPGIIISATEPTETDVLWADTSAAGSMVVPAGGSTGQVLAKASASDYDSEWITPSSGGIPATIIDAAGDLIVGTAADTAARLAVGTNGYVLTADSAQTGGMKWNVAPFNTAMRSGYFAQSSAILTASNNAAILNRAYAAPMVFPTGTVISALAIYVSSAAASGNVARIAIYNDNNGVPGTVHSQSTLAADSIGAKTWTLPTNYTVSRLFWVAVAIQGSGAAGNYFQAWAISGWPINETSKGAATNTAAMYWAASSTFADNPSLTYEEQQRQPLAWAKVV